MKKKYTIPYSSLILYSKDWISFNDPDNLLTVFDEFKYVMKLCGIIAAANPVFQVLRAYDDIKMFIESYNKENPEEAVYYPKEMNSFELFEKEVQDTILLWKMTHDEAVMIIICSILQRLDISKFNVNRIDYKEHKKLFHMGGMLYKPGMTYTQQQKIFDEQFTNQLN